MREEEEIEGERKQSKKYGKNKREYGSDRTKETKENESLKGREREEKIKDICKRTRTAKSSQQACQEHAGQRRGRSVSKTK